MSELPHVPLSAAAAAVPGSEVRGDRHVAIREVAYDSRDVPPGSLFFCVTGATEDGHRFAAPAVRSGAVAVVVERWLDLDVPQLRVPSVRRSMGPVSSVVFGEPARSMTTIGVTGTNGKTTVVHLLDAAFRAAGRTTGAIGTVGARVAGAPVPIARTTPEAPDLQRLLARMRSAGVTVVAMEVSSHALDQERVAGLRFDAAVFTNLSQDHLDHHGSMEAYFAAKASLFDRDRARHAVLNLDDEGGRRLLQVPVPVTTYGLDPAADVRAVDVRAGPDGVAFRVDGREVTSPLRGAFNVSNCLAAMAVADRSGVDRATTIDALADPGSVPGRMEPVDAGQRFLVVVDYAHTPDSIRTVLAAARPLTTGRVIVVFGCGGDRDRVKRFPMGAAATEGADLTVITTDNPRSEDPSVIIAEVERGAASTGGRYVVEPDRRTAIRLAVAEAGPGDVVVIAGKGHETEQELGGRVVPFDDRVVAREELEAIGARG
ncbi:MAG TPA: UDP-N-acetylmuramoyl-L-alanyl-D-glutamate--2,6-diaminopimelate ligase [Actinomycetota bacterium]|nr:UDP-N-acetylmuramoyl-L-alanyl-D-glutamate--2,6-diaminopimelate ligase [Actinomycetota bacterium]